MQFLKSLFLGAPSITFKLLGDMVLALLMKIGWRVIFERLLTRVMVGCLNWLARLNTNKIWQATVNDILKDFQDRGLTKAVAYEARRIKRNHPGD